MNGARVCCRVPFFLAALLMGCKHGPAPSEARVTPEVAPVGSAVGDTPIRFVGRLYTRYRTLQGLSDSVPSWLVLVRTTPGEFAPWIPKALEGLHRDQLQRGGDAIDPGFDWFTGSVSTCDRYEPATPAPSSDTLFVPLVCVQGGASASEANAVLALRRVGTGWRIEDIGYLDGTSMGRMLSDYYEHGD